jgi:hypothetical protein
MSRLPDLIIPFKRPVYDKVVAAFARLGAPSASMMRAKKEGG